MFSESADLYDVIYRQFKDYADESRRIANLLERVHADGKVLLDVACGTGEHARHLAGDYGYRVDGLDVDPEFVRLAQQKNPSGRFVCADMVHTAEADQVTVCRMSHSARRGETSVLTFHYLIGRGEGIEHVTETHELGLFTREQLEGCFRAAGFTAVEYDSEGLIGRGLFTARVTEWEQGP